MYYKLKFLQKENNHNNFEISKKKYYLNILNNFILNKNGKWNKKFNIAI